MTDTGLFVNWDITSTPDYDENEFTFNRSLQEEPIYASEDLGGIVIFVY